MAIERFEVGHWYRWTKGIINVPAIWNIPGGMGNMRDGQPRKCINTHAYCPDWAAFEGMPHPLGPKECWNWADLSGFEEVKDMVPRDIPTASIPGTITCDITVSSVDVDFPRFWASLIAGKKPRMKSRKELRKKLLGL